MALWHVLRQSLGALGFALVVTALLTAGLRRMLVRLRRVDIPRPDRWHRTPVPRPGGPAIFLGIVLGMIAFLPRPWSLPVWGLLIGCTYIFAVGLADDTSNLPNPLKLVLLIVGAVIPLFFGVSFAMVPAPLGVMLAMLWILGITNAENWLDNMDGLAAGVGAIAAGTLMLLSLRFGDAAGGIAAAVIAGACLGFLFFNFAPARIFMGDSGSGVLGFALATLALIGTGRHATNVVLTLLVPVVVLSIPILDTVVVTITRFLNGRRLFQGGTDHPSHRLVLLGLSERQAVLSLYGLSVLSAAVALAASGLGLWPGLALAGVLACGFVAFGIVLTRVRVYDEMRTAAAPGSVVLWQVMHKRRLFEMLLDLVLICLAFLVAYLLRFEGDVPVSLMRRMGQALPLVIALKMSALYAAGVYQGDWRYVGLLDLLTLARGTALGSLLVVGALFFWTRLVDHSRAALIIDGVLTFGFLAVMRVSVRLLQEYFAARRVRGRTVIIAGAGQGGVLLLQELRQNDALPYRPIGFVDDDPVKQGAVIRGLPVLGTFREIPALVARLKVEEVLVAAPSMNRTAMDRIVLICSEAGIPARAMRSLLEPAD
jgi:UDP-GlcNAc:undecaprenyl-phosphate GlcNAc-1-phosphate transferase